MASFLFGSEGDAPRQWGWDNLSKATAVVVVPLSLLLCYYITASINNVFFHPLREYPGPLLARATTVPRFVHTVRGTAIEWINELHLKYGSVVRVAPNELSYSSANSWKDIYGKGSKIQGRKWTGLYDPRNPQWESLNGPVSDEYHDEMRQLINPAFSERALREQEYYLLKSSRAMVNRLHRFISETPNQPLDLAKMFMCCTFDILGALAFNEPLGMVEQMKYVPWIEAQFKNLQTMGVVAGKEYFTVLKPLLSLALWLFPSALGGPLKFATAQVDRRVAREPEKPDLWSYIMRNNKANRQLSLREMYTHGILFIVAGTETSATCLAVTTFLLAKDPERLKKVTEEVRSSFKSTDEITLQALTQMPYLQACLEEGLRIHPPVPVGLPRTVPPEGAFIDGKWVAPNTVVYTSATAAHSMPENFRDPLSFIPERWISDKYNDDVKSASQPFIVGPRNCVGKGLAWHEMRLILASLLLNFDLELMEESSNWKEVQRVWILWEKLPLMMKLTPVAPS